MNYFLVIFIDFSFFKFKFKFEFLGRLLPLGTVSVPLAAVTAVYREVTDGKKKNPARGNPAFGEPEERAISSKGSTPALACEL
jgi:hypothetical protein